MNVGIRVGGALLALLPATALAQAGDASAVFLVRQNVDTIAAERATIGPRHAESVMRVRASQQQVRQLVETDTSGAAQHMITLVGRGARGDSAAKQLEITVDGDSGTAQPFDAAAPAPLPALRAGYQQHSREVLPAFRISGPTHPLEKVPAPKYCVKEC